jgi:hypothetical protein
LRLHTGEEGRRNPQRRSDDEDHESGFVERRFDGRRFDERHFHEHR